jgi:lysozyme
VSHHAGDVDFAMLRNEGFTFCYMKASEGVNYRDPKYRTNFRRAQAAGIRTGAYHFFRFNKPGADQARHFLSTIGQDAHELPMVIDFEFHGNGNANTNWDNDELIRKVQEFIKVIREETGRDPILYTEYMTYYSNIYQRGLDVKFWIACVDFQPKIPNMVIWQSHIQQRHPAVNGFLDYDLMIDDL